MNESFAIQFIENLWEPLRNEFSNFDILHPPACVAMGSSIFVLIENAVEVQIELWKFQALYYDIYIPIVK